MLTITAPGATPIDQNSAVTTDIAIDFSASGNGASATGAGWSKPEPTETWTVGARSLLSLPAPTMPATYVLVIKLRPQVVEGRLPSQRLGISVNGVRVDEFTLSRRNVRTCLLPWNLLSVAPTLEIAFTMPDAARLSDFGPSPDRRLLGFAFESLLLYPSAHEEWQAGGGLSGPEPLPVNIASILAADQMQLQDLMLQFESLGQNCEFGLLQRQCKAEPLGLLRFSSTPLPKLLHALEHGFEGMGAKGSIEIDISPNGIEYMVRDLSFGFPYHAWVNTGEMTADEVCRREERRVPFLLRKLMEELQAGEKTFVFKGMGAMPKEEVFPLSAALRRYSPNTLLFVNIADAEHSPGTVEARAPGFLVGYVDRFAPSENAGNLALSQRVHVCREAYRLRLAAY